MMSDILSNLGTVLERRKSDDPGSSYVATLYAEGMDAILRKIGEEATEVILAAKSGNSDALVHETADLWFHTLVMLATQGLGPGDVLAELEGRFGTSGLKERAERKSTRAAPEDQ